MTQECGRCYELCKSEDLGAYGSREICQSCLCEIEDDLKVGVVEDWYEEEEKDDR